MCQGEDGSAAAARAIAAIGTTGTGAPRSGGWGRRAGFAGAAIGAMAAGAAVERLTFHRTVRRNARIALDAAGPYGSLRGTAGTVRAGDGTELYYEIDDATGDAWRDERTEGDGQALTVVFTHGYCLSQDSWHFQRAALRGLVPAVYWDHRSHGRSGRAPMGEPVSVDTLGRDLKAVLDAAVPEGPVVLVGHSMGGMTLMALADQYPEYIAERVAGVAFVDTSAGGLGEVTYGLPLPAAGVRAVRRVVPGVLKVLVARTELVERGRRAATDLFSGLIKRYSFGSGRDVDPAVARFAERLIESVPLDVVAEFYPAFDSHEKTAALATFRGCPALVLAGDRDLLTPHAHSVAIAGALPAARLVTLERTGHLAMLERPQAVDEALAALISRAAGGTGH